MRYLKGGNKTEAISASTRVSAGRTATFHMGPEPPKPPTPPTPSTPSPKPPPVRHCAQCSGMRDDSGDGGTNKFPDYSHTEYKNPRHRYTHLMIRSKSVTDPQRNIKKILQLPMSTDELACRSVKCN